MDKYQTIQLEAASQILEILGLPYPHTLEEKIKTIEASKAVLGSRIEAPVKNYCIAMQEVANHIKADRSRQDDSSIQKYPRKTCVLETPNLIASFPLQEYR